MCSFTEVFFLTLDLTATFGVLFAGLEAVEAERVKVSEGGICQGGRCHSQM